MAAFFLHSAWATKLSFAVLLILTFPFCSIFQVELIDPAVKGTLNVLRSCAKVPAIRRVVVTSSIAAVIYNGKPLTSDVIVDETWFSDPAFCEESKVGIHANFSVLIIYFSVNCFFQGGVYEKFNLIS